MAWTAPRTWVTGEIPTAVMMNALSDQFRAMMPAAALNAGDIFFGVGLNTLIRMGMGGALSFLRFLGGLPSWGGIALAQPMVFVNATDLVLKVTDNTSPATIEQSMTNVVQATITTQGGPVLVWGLVWVNEAKFGTGFVVHQAEIMLDELPLGNSFITFNQGGPVGSGASASDTLIFLSLFQPNQVLPGKHIWTIRATFNGDHTVTTVPCRANGTLMLMELQGG